MTRTRKRPAVWVRKFTVGQMAENCYVLIDSDSLEALIIDPGDDATYLAEQISKERAKPIAILATHGHFDHILAAFELQLIYQVPFRASHLDQFLLDRMGETAEHFLGHKIVEMAPKITKPILEGEKITFGSNFLTALSTPGHTPGSMSFHCASDNYLFVGDTIFAHGSVGRTDFSYSDKGKLDSSIRRILTLADSMVLYPGHGEETTVISEKVYHL